MPAVQSTCRQCGKQAPADSFVMDHYAKIMVCPQCAKNNRTKNVASAPKPAVKNDYTPAFTTPFKEGSRIAGKQAPTNTVKVVSEQKPKDWDSDDDVLAKSHTKKTATLEQGNAYRCSKCGYLFKKSAAVGKVYSKCPFCNTVIV